MPTLRIRDFVGIEPQSKRLEVRGRAAGSAVSMRRRRPVGAVKHSCAAGMALLQLAISTQLGRAARANFQMCLHLTGVELAVK